MKILRSHILKVGITLLVFSGMMMGLARPANAARSNKDFADWLQSLAKNTRSSDLKKELASLEKSEGDLNQIIAKASRIVSENGDDFNFPVHAASEDLQQLLLVEWNQYQMGSNTMTTVPSVEVAKPVIMPQQQNYGPGHLKAVEPARFLSHHYSFICSITDPAAFLLCAPAPMASGIAIGAP